VRHPSTISCDLCQNQIDTKKPWPTLSYPLPADLRQRIEDEATSSTNAQFARIFPMMIAMVPDHYRLDICKGCIDGLLPQINETVRLRVIAFMRERAERMPVPDDEDD
jgi:hypothetical protein